MRYLSGDSRLILCALAGDIMEIAGSSLVQLGRDLTPNGRISQHLKQLEKSGLISHSGATRVDRRIFRLTAEGRACALGADNPEKLWARPWAGTWTLVVFDVPEAQVALRARFRRKLRQLRFGWLQNSVWVSPDPASMVTNHLGADGIAPASLSVFEARPAGGETAADLVSSAWDLARLDRDYASYRKVLEHRPTGAQSDPPRWKKWIEQEQRAWRRICAIDPFLPEVLLPAAYAGQKAWRQRLQAYADLCQALGGKPAPVAP